MQKTSYQKRWNDYYRKHQTNAPWHRKEPDQHIIDFTGYYRFPKGTVILESGCGLGKNSKFLIQENYEVYGIDIAEFAIKYIKNLGLKGHFSIQDASKPNFKDDFFDAIIDEGCIQSSPPSLANKIIQQYQRILKPSGNLFIDFFKNPPKHPPETPLFYEDNLPAYGHTKGDIEKLLQKKFRIEKNIENINTLPCATYYVYLEKI